MKRRLSLLWKVLVPTAVILLIVMGAMSLSAYRVARNSLEKTIIRQMQGQSEVATQNLSEWIEGITVDLELMRQDDGIANAFQDNFMGRAARRLVSERFADLVERYPLFNRLGLAQADGRVIASSIESKSGPPSVADKPFFQASISGEMMVSDVFISETNGVPVFVISLPVTGKKGEKGVFWGGVRMEALMKSYIDPIQVAETGYAYIINAQGMCIAHPDRGLVLTADISGDEFGQTIMREKEGVVRYQWEGIEKFAVFDAYERKGWFMVVTAPVDEVFADIYRLRKILLGIGLGGILLQGISIGWLLRRIVSAPLERVAGTLTGAAERVHSGAAQISSMGRTVAVGASDQAASIEETSSSLEEMSSMTRQNAENADLASQLARNSLESFKSTRLSMDQLSAAMEEIEKANAETQRIIKTIDEIAFQTNLLALNAAVEAARAGEAGAGFAVVAEEVRNLALRASQASQDTARLIEGAASRVKDGARLAETVQNAFGDVSEHADRVSQLLAEISAASGEQAEGIRQTNSAVSKMDDVVQQNASNAQQASASAEELTNQAEALRRSVRQLALILGSGVRIGLTPGEPRPSPALPNRLQLKDGLEQTDKPKLPVKGENQ